MDYENLTPQYRIEEYLEAIVKGWAEATQYPYPGYPSWRIEEFLDAFITYIWEDGDHPRHPCPGPVWRLEECLRAIYDVMTGAATPWAFPTPTNSIEEYLAAIHAYLADGTELPVPEPVWRIEQWLAYVLDAVKQGGGGTETTVTGNLPLTLANAISDAIVSLTRYGLCAQASAPTLADPVPIKCNNGTLTVVDDDLPTGYKRVQGFSVNDDCYWRLTDFKLNGSDTLRFAFSVTAACNVIGAYSGNASGNNMSLYVAVSGTGKYLRYKDRSYNSGIDTDTRYDVAITPTGSVGMKTDSTWDELSFTTTTDFCIGTTSTSTTSAKLKGSLFGNITVDGRLDLVPCERISDGMLGYYDLVGEAFYAPTYGTPTSLSYDYDHVHVEAVGTPEVLTVGGTNLLNVATNTTGKCIYAGGNIAGGDGQYTDLIPVTVGNLYVCAFTSARDSGTNRLHGYNSNGTWVKQLSYALATGMQGKKVALSALIPSGISYIRLSYGQTDTDAIISQEPIPSNEFYVGRVGSGTKAYINSLESTITSPYSASAYHGFGIVTPVVPESAYAFTWSGTGLNTYGIGFYASIDDVTDVSKCISGGSIKELSTFVVPSGANYAVLVFANASPKTLTLDYLYVNPTPTYAPYVPPQTASVPMLLSVGDVKDEVELIAGTLTRRVTACLYDGTQPVGDVYMSTTGGKDVGAIIVYPLATPTTEQITGQNLVTNEGTNIVDATAEVEPLTAEVTYKANA